MPSFIFVNKNIFRKILFITYIILISPPVIEQTQIGSANSLNLIGEYLLYISVPLKITILIYIFLNLPKLLHSLRTQRQLNFLLGFISVFSLLSISQHTSLIALFNLYLTYAFILTLSTQIEPTRLLKIFTGYNLFLITIGFALLIIGSDTVFQCDITCAENYYKGIYAGKNSLGLALAITIFSLLNFYNHFSISKTWRNILILTIASGLIYSNSVSPLFALLISLTFQLIQFSPYSFKKHFFKNITIISITATLFTVFLLDWALEIFGRDANLSGRSSIVNFIISNISIEAFYGSGYVTSIENIRLIDSSFEAIDNSWIVMLIEFGVFYTFAYILWIIYNIYTSLRSANRVKIISGSAFIFLFIYGFAEKASGPYVSQLFIFFTIIYIWSNNQNSIGTRNKFIYRPNFRKISTFDNTELYAKRKIRPVLTTEIQRSYESL